MPRTNPRHPTLRPAPRPDDKLVAVVVDPSTPYDRAIAMGAAQYAREQGTWRLYVEEEQPRRLPDFNDWPGHGIIASFDDDRVARAVIATGLPVVAVGGGGGGFDPSSRIPYVETDNERIAWLAAEHLLARGLEHFGFYGLPATPATIWSEARCTGFTRSIHDDILHVRLEEARRLVTSTDLPIKAVAPRAGFSSVAYMTTLFRHHFGMPPAALRAASRGRGTSLPTSET